MMPTRVQDIQQHHLSAASGSGRDGGHYGGGGCGGLEVFAFLAFLLALLDLFLDVNELAVDIDVNTERRTRRAHFSSPAGCTNDVGVAEGIWAAGRLAKGVLMATTTTPTCGNAHMCHAAATAATKGPLAATLTSLAGQWLARWPALNGSSLGATTLLAASTLTCPAIDDACMSGDGREAFT
ncbi:uncharacterized protein LOC123506978 [Portunus trituberculatus]|uniref:uncharacterized protein LOC123506978 n=1 Tax=Portunus trituberculatus TaxID=210409 RepID=UPI001E1CFC14|nr:uncharacterized protein LOC123506978 [Portunus trituberculatus]